MPIIALSGRKHNGKTEISRLFENAGFKRISFADELKNICYKLYGFIDRNELELKKENSIILIIDNNKYSLLENLLGFNCRDKVLNKVFNSPREFLQFIGTEIIRKYDPDWHVKKLIEKINTIDNFIIDDLRFPNELLNLRKRGAICFYVIRSNYFNYSNHSSETALQWFDFPRENIILNNYSVNLLRKKVLQFIQTLSNKDFTSRRMEISSVLNKVNWNTKQAAIVMGCSRDKVIWWCHRLLLFIPKNTQSYDELSFSTANPTSSYLAGLLAAIGSIGCGKNSNNSLYAISLGLIDKQPVELFQSFIKTKKKIDTCILPTGKCFWELSITSAFILHNIKLWDLNPQKSCFEKIPTIIENNIDMLKYWIVGLIDGDGSIEYIGKVLYIQILASKEVIDFLKKNIPVKSNIHKHYESKDKILYDLCFYGKHALFFYKWLGKATNLGINRKWDKIRII